MVDPRFWGPHAWTLFHTIALQYPEQPSEEHKAALRNFVGALPWLLPCGGCQAHFRQLIADLPPREDSRDELRAWFNEAHNRVNARLGKPVLDLVVGERALADRFRQTIAGEAATATVKETSGGLGYVILGVIIGMFVALFAAGALSQSPPRASSFPLATPPRRWTTAAFQ
jgi:hypothetical protein